MRVCRGGADVAARTRRRHGRIRRVTVTESAPAAPPAAPVAAATRHRVVIVGAGFGGVACVRDLVRDQRLDVTVIDRNPYHLFSPLLYQVATAGLPEDDIAHPVRAAVRGARFRRAEVTGVDPDQRVLTLADGSTLAYDTLVLATGSVGNDFGVPGVREHAMQMKSLPEARRIRHALLRTYEEVAAGTRAPAALHTVVIGGGPTGVEVAGAVAELQRALSREFPELRGQAEVDLIEMGPRILPTFTPASSRHATDALRRMGVQVMTGSAVAEVTDVDVALADGRRLAVGVVVWASGVSVPEPWASLGETAAGGRLRVAASLQLRPGIWVVGDMAYAVDGRGRPCPQQAPFAMQGGRHVAQQIRRELDHQPPTPFRYRDKGQMATIGRARAVVELPGGLRLFGTPAWLAWLALHLAYLAGTRNRISVVGDWAWNYVAWSVGSPRPLTE